MRDIGYNHTDRSGKEWFQLTKPLKTKENTDSVVRQLGGRDHKVEMIEGGCWCVFIPMKVHLENAR